MIRLGIVGAGFIAEEMVQKFPESNQVTINALYSRTFERAQTFCQKHKLPEPVRSFEELLENCDAVYIASQNNTHYEYALRALEAGKHVLCEKPICVYEEHLKHLIAIAESKNLILVEAQRLWTKQTFTQVKSLIDHQEIGEILGLEASLGSSGQRLERRVLEYGGGALFDLCVYPIFAFLYLIGDIEKIQAYAHFFKTGVDDYTMISVQHKGIIGNLSASFNTNTRGELRINGTKGTITIPKIFTIHDDVYIQKENQQIISCQQDSQDMTLMVLEFSNYIQGKDLEKYRLRKEFSIKSIEITDKVRQQVNLVYPF